MADTDRMNIEKPDFMSDEDWATILDQTSSLERIRSDGKADVEAYLADPAGRASGAGPSGLPTLLLTTIGRKSGVERTVALVFLQHGEEMVVVGSLAGYDRHPAWSLNAQANPDCWVQLDDRKMKAVARQASDEERKALWPKLNELFPVWAHFQKQTDRPFPIVILSPTGPA
jgi:deazaflavin-dependent oxidoreductase (nitroreductase family)